MYLNLDVLKSFQSDLIFHSLVNIINIDDCECITNKPQKKLSKDKLFWLHYDQVTQIDIENQSAIFLIDWKQYHKLGENNIKNARLIISSDPKHIFLTICSFFDNDEIIHEKHPTAIIHPNAKIGLNVYIGPYTTIEDCIIGDNCIINSHCSIGKGVKIGFNSEIHSGAKIGLSVFGYEKNPDDKWIKYPQSGFVQIGNNVTIGANTSISNGFINNTIIEDDTIIDNLCQIGSSVLISKNTKIAANSTICNNTKIGQRCWIAPGVTIKENLIIADDVFIGLGSVVIKNIRNSCKVFGIPASPI